MIKKLIFDLDNTLIMWKPEYVNALRKTLQKYNINEIYISYHSGDKKDYRITLGSNGQKLEFMVYSNNCFADVGTYDGDYKAGDSKDESWEIYIETWPIWSDDRDIG